MEEKIKEAFQQVKYDIFTLGNELAQIRTELRELKIELKLISTFIDDMKMQKLTKEEIPTHQQISPTIPIKNQAQNQIPTDDLPLYSPKSQDMQVSIGNRGVPTNRQTNRQTNQHIIKYIENNENSENKLEKASEILASLDSLKKEVRLKFKRLTSQEMQVFSALYTLEEQNPVDYKLLASKLSLSESSIRDYILKIQKKGIPISKEKLNNKRVILHISEDLKKIASLNTIIKLREL